MHLDSEQVIVEKAMSGDINSFEKLVILYDKTVYNVCYRYFYNTEDAKDITQEVFLKIFRNISKYNFQCSFSTWVYKVTVNCCLDALRKRKSRPQTESINKSAPVISDSENSLDDAVIRKEYIDYLSKTINNLPPEHKLYIIMRDVNGLSYRDIATITDNNIGTVKSKISRARQFLRQILKSCGEEVI